MQQSNEKPNIPIEDSSYAYLEKESLRFVLAHLVQPKEHQQEDNTKGMLVVEQRLDQQAIRLQEQFEQLIQRLHRLQ